MSYTYFLNDVFAVEQDTALYAQNGVAPNLNEYDYIVTLPCNLRDMFSAMTYQQNSQDANLFNVDLTINDSALNSTIAASNMVQQASNLATGIVATNTVGFDTRVLEILALKIFGHARARAAIANDTTITATLNSDLSNHVHNVVSTHKDDIFCQYVQQDNPDLNANDVNAPVDFNFASDYIAFPGYVAGSLIDQPNLSADLLNGPADQSTHSLVNGAYNVPILIRLGGL